MVLTMVHMTNMTTKKTTGIVTVPINIHCIQYQLVTVIAVTHSSAYRQGDLITTTASVSVL